MSDSKEEINTSSAPTKPKRSRWWLWILGILLLLVFCDDDDDRRRANCYRFGEEKRCFKEPLPEDQYCYLMQDDVVRCYDQPLD